MITVIAIDALEYLLVEEYGNKNLKQASYGKTDITEFREPRTMVLWSSFMTGANKEKEVLAKGDKEMWNIRWPIEDTFFSGFENPKIIDLPGLNYDTKVHDKSRRLLKEFFDAEEAGEKEKKRKEYNEDAFRHHRNVKKEFLASLTGDYDFLLGYFCLTDVVGHLNFGNKTMMKLIHQDLDETAGKTTEKSDKTIILSDHGMKAIGAFGDHSKYGYWSTSWKQNLKKPKITDFKEIILKLKNQ
ncbi:MAG: alkaline phosphatase family protein [Candidatus Altiarchaeota archaeon]